MPQKDFQELIADAGQVERILACLEFSKALVSAYDMETLLTAVLERIKLLIPARNWSLLLVDRQTRELYFAVTVGVDHELLKGVRLKMGEGIAGTVAQTGQPIFIPEACEDERFCQRVDEITGFATRSIIALPLLVRGEVIGVFEVINVENQEFFREKYLPLLEILGDYVAIAVDNVYNLQKLQARTFIDEVTGFYNTRYLACKLDKYIPEILAAGHQELSVVFLDLDDFKQVVDRHGHLLGTKVLAEVARVGKGKITFWGEIDRQHVLPARDPQVGRDAVRLVARHLYDRAGGIIAQFELTPGSHGPTAIAIFEEWDRVEAEARANRPSIPPGG